jgi:hypothetical protein
MRAGLTCQRPLTVDLQQAEQRVRTVGERAVRALARRSMRSTPRRNGRSISRRPHRGRRCARLTAKGLEFDVRYPVQPERAAAIDQRMIQSLHAELAREPTLAMHPRASPH